MAANYYLSTQYRYWSFSKETLAVQRQKVEDENADLVRRYPLPGHRELCMYFNSQINRLAKRLNIRPQATATAQVYIKRFYTRVQVQLTNPYLVMVTALYLACKAEECPHHIRYVLSESRTLWPDMVALDTSRIGECEFWLLSEMNTQIVIYHPMRSLTMLRSELSIGPEEAALASTVLLDHYMTDLPLLYPPHVIAVAAVLLALTPGTMGSTLGSATTPTTANTPTTAGAAPPRDTPQSDASADRMADFAEWLGNSDIDIEGVVECVQEMVSFYECQESHNNKRTQEQINRFIKARGLDK